MYQSSYHTLNVYLQLGAVLALLVVGAAWDEIFDAPFGGKLDRYAPLKLWYQVLTLMIGWLPIFMWAFLETREDMKDDEE